MSVKRYSIYAVSGDKGWEKRPSPKGDFVMSSAFDHQMKRMQDIIRSLLLTNNPDVQPAEAHAIFKEARKVAGIPEPKV